jgi:hypothetical protein
VEGGESRLAIEVIGVIAGFDAEWADAFASKLAPTEDL